MVDRWQLDSKTKRSFLCFLAKTTRWKKIQFVITMLQATVRESKSLLYFSQGVTVCYYNVDPIPANSQRRKRQADSSSQPSTLYLGFETSGSDPINVEFTANEREEVFVPTPTPVINFKKYFFSSVSLVLVFYSIYLYVLLYSSYKLWICLGKNFLLIIENLFYVAPKNSAIS